MANSAKKQTNKKNKKQIERHEKLWENGLQNNYTYILSAENREK